MKVFPRQTAKCGWCAVDVGKILIWIVPPVREVFYFFQQLNAWASTVYYNAEFQGCSHSSLKEYIVSVRTEDIILKGRVWPMTKIFGILKKN